MRPFPTSGENSEPNSPIQQLIAGALGIPEILTVTPTSTNNVLRLHGDCGIISNKLYINLGGTIYEWSLTQTA